MTPKIIAANGKEGIGVANYVYAVTCECGRTIVFSRSMTSNDQLHDDSDGFCPCGRKYSVRFQPPMFGVIRYGFNYE